MSPAGVARFRRPLIVAVAALMAAGVSPAASAPSGAPPAEVNPWGLMVKRESTRLLAVSSLSGAFWGVGERGGFMTSVDGKLWNRPRPFTDRTLYGVSFGDATTGVAVGEGGFIASTDDAGATWRAAKPPVTEDLRGVCFGSRNVGVAVGLRGVLLVSSDAGRSWSRKDLGVMESLMAVTMPSPKEAWVVGERGIILHSRDAGGTWTTERQPSAKWLYGVWFFGETGWAVGRDGLVLRYLMKKWEVIPVPGAIDSLYCVCGSSGDAVTVVGAGGKAWNTPDAGVTWTPRETGSREDLTGIAQTGKVAWAVGGENALLSSIDGGDAWATYSLENLPSYVAVSFVDDSTGWVVGRAGLIWNTRDGGRNWGQQDAGMRKDFHAVFAASRLLCFAVGESVIVKTDDGGLAWRRVWQEPPLTAAELEKPKALRKPPIVLNDIFFFDTRRGWAAGSEGVLLYTGNEGESWERLRTGFDRALYSVWFDSPSHGFIAAEDGRLYATDSGGRRWTAVSTGGGGEALRAIFFLDADRGWAVGDGGTILRTTDGGRVWKEMRVGGAVSLRDVCFVDRARGWVVGDRGVLLRTWDGGDTWSAEKPPVPTDFYGLWFVSPQLGWAVGDRGVILRYRPGGAG